MVVPEKLEEKRLFDALAKKGTFEFIIMKFRRF